MKKLKNKQSVKASKLAKEKNLRKNCINVQNSVNEPDTTAEVVVRNQVEYTPKVSVIMPVYNVENYLRQCLDSVINQTLKDIEIICVDDGSSDQSLKILQEYAAKDKRITVLKQNNLFAGVARNAGIAVAKGKYLSFLDSDDFFELDMLEEVYKVIEQEKSEIVFYRYTSYDNETQQPIAIRGIRKKYLKEGFATYTTDELKDELFTVCNHMPWNKMISRKFVMDEGLRYQNLPASNDGCFSLTAIACANKITLMNRSFVYYRFNRQDSLINTRDKYPLVFYQAYRGIAEILQQKGLFEKYKKTFLSAFLSTAAWTVTRTDKEKDTVKEFIKNTIVPEFKVNENLSLLSETTRLKLERLYHPDLIISLTSFPARIEAVAQTITTLIEQSLPADKVILWLAPEQFPNREQDLPESLLQLCNQGLTIGWYHDIRSYKKLIPTLRQYPEAIIVTADDDNLYDRNWLKKLFASYVKYPHDIQCHRVTKFYYDQGFGTIAGGRDYHKGANYLNKLVGLGGVLYPPHCFYKDILNEDLIKELAPTNDDQWFWLQAALNNVKVRVVENPDITAHYVPGTQEFGLTHINDHGKKLFWKDFNRIMAHYPQLEKKLIAAGKRYKVRGPHLAPYQKDFTAWFKKLYGHQLNLDNPHTFNEKMQWLKLYDSTPIKTRLADKYLVRDWVEEKIGKKYLIPLLGVYDRFEDIDFAGLPDSFVIKCNHGCKYNIIVKDKSKLDLAEVKANLDKWMKDNFAYRTYELQYRDIEPKIIIEQFIANEHSEELNDYKFYCFGGKVKYVQVISERDEHGHKVSFYDTNWNKQNWWDNRLYEGQVERPQKLDEMLQLAQKLCKGFCFVRVDLYYLDTGEIYFGEMTFTPGSGRMHWSSEKVNLCLGKMIKLPSMAYNMDTCKYYKLPTQNMLLRPYYLWIKPNYSRFKLWLIKKRKMAAIEGNILDKLSSFRIDLKNKGKSGNAMKISGNGITLATPEWFTNKQGQGQVVHCKSDLQHITIQAIEDGKLLFAFKGIDCRYLKDRLPLWVDIESIKIDGKELLKKTISVWHDEAYEYKMPVKNGQKVNVDIVKTLHMYSRAELKNLIYKLETGDEFLDLYADEITDHIMQKIMAANDIVAPSVVKSVNKAERTRKNDKFILSYKLFNFLPIFTYKQRDCKRVWKLFGLPVWKTDKNKSKENQYYLFNLPLIKIG